MNWFIHLFIFNLFILTSTAGGDSTCICNSGGGFGLFCGFDLAGSDCSGEILAHILQCGDKECTGCPDSKWQKPMFSTQSNTTASTPTTYQPKSTSSIQTSAAPSGSSSGSSSVSPSDVGSEFHVKQLTIKIATILGAVIGGICAIFATIIGVKCKRKKQNKLNSQNKVNSQNKQISQNDQNQQDNHFQKSFNNGIKEK
ncbi:17782_t:CDS:2 [Rhizophagus irregularis]|nr:17782_t:CDS:2 [Rhizophagus irregularis]